MSVHSYGLRLALGVLCLCCVSVSVAKDFGLILGEREVSARQRSMTLNSVILKTKGGFKGDLDIDVTVDPATSDLQIEVDGAVDGKVPSDSINVSVIASPNRNTAPGEYRITVTLRGEVDGKAVMRQQSYTLVVTAPPQFDLMVAPERIIMPQGGTASTTITTILNDTWTAPIDLGVYMPGFGSAFTTRLSGGGEESPHLFSGGLHWLVSSPMAEGDGFIDTVLTVTADPATPAGDYLFHIEGYYNPRWIGGDYRPTEAPRPHRIPLHVTVTADPRYAHLQDPPGFHLTVPEPIMVVPADTGPLGRFSWVGAWGDRWKSAVVLELRMKDPSSPVRHALARGMRSLLKLPTSDRAYSVDSIVAVPPGTPPGDYPSILTGTSTAVNGKTLTKSEEIIIRVPPPPQAAPPAATGADTASDSELPGIDSWEELPDTTPYVQDFQWPAELMDAAIGSACELLSEAADTIACSVHSFKKPDTEKADPVDDVSIGQSHERSAGQGGGYDTEVFIRNPDDNNLRQGCGDLNDELLTRLTGITWPPPPPGAEETRYEYLSCNAAAQSNGKKRAFIRSEKRRDYLETDTSEARRADYKRQQDRSYASADRGNLGAVVGEAGTAATNDGVPLQSCPAKPRVDRADKQVDAQIDKLPSDLIVLANDVQAVGGAKDGLASVDAGAKVVAGVNDAFTHAGTEYRPLKLTSDSLKLGLQMTEMSIKGLEGERITALEAKGVVDTVAELTGNRYVKTVSNSFDALLSLESLRLRIANGEKIEVKDVSALAEKINTLRGDRFAALGQVLEGITTNANRIEKANELVEQLGKATEFLDKLDDARGDPEKAFEAFGEYLDMLGSIAGKVPGMGEFMEQYAAAVKNMGKDVATISEAVKKRNEAIEEVGVAIEGYDYEKLLLDAEQFEEDFHTEGAGRRLSADQINVDLNVADELAAAEEARRHWRQLQRCVIQSMSRMEAIKRHHKRLGEQRKDLKDQKTLERDAKQLRARADYQSGVENSSKLVTLKQAQNMGFASVRDAKAFLENETNSPRLALDRADEAERLARRRAFITQRRKELREEWFRLKDKRDECAKKLPIAELAYWQALRDYTAEYAFYSLYLQEDRRTWTKDNQAKLVHDALAAIDAQIIKQGFAIDEGRVKIIVVDECATNSRRSSVGR